MRRTGSIFVLAVIACLQGSFMIIDGIHHITTGSYIGGKAGPWAVLVRAAGVSENSMAPAFIVLGTLWLLGAGVLLISPRRGASMLAIPALVTLLYPLFGTLLAIVALVIIWKQRDSVNAAASVSQKAG
jgi:hypothetical protein